MKKGTVRKGLTASALLGLSLASSMGYAAEGFKVRFPLSGSLGGEMVAPIKPGVFGSIAYTKINTDKITGNDGKTMTGFSGAVVLGFDQQTDLYNLILGYTTTEKYADGHLTFAMNVPYASVDRKVNATLLDGSLTNQLRGLNAAGSGQVGNFGDIELTTLWSRQTEKAKVAVGVTVSLPTGHYNTGNLDINIGYGDFYTIRPGAAIAYKATDDLTLGARASVAFNTKNHDKNWRSGDFYALDLAAAYKTPIGVVGPHILYIQQFKDDIGAVTFTGAPMGANRFSSNSAGVFFTTLIPGINAGLNLSYMKTLESKNALSGSFIQARLSKVF